MVVIFKERRVYDQVEINERPGGQTVKYGMYQYYEFWSTLNLGKILNKNITTSYCIQNKGLAYPAIS